jgi:tight adherence protein B
MTPIWPVLSIFGLGVWLLYQAIVWPRQAPKPELPRWRGLRAWLLEAGLERVTPQLFFSIIVVSAAMGGLIGRLLFGWPVLEVVGVVAGGVWYPVWVRARRRHRRQEVRRALPEGIDRICAALGAGQTTDQAVIGLVSDERESPELEVLRPYFQVLKNDLALSGDFAHAVEEVRQRLADETFDQVASALVLHSVVGGQRLRSTLAARAARLRADLAMRDRIAGERSRTMLSARVMLVLPVGLLLLVRFWQPATAETLSTVTGQAILAGCALVVLSGYALVLRIGRLPEEERVLGSR